MGEGPPKILLNPSPLEVDLCTVVGVVEILFAPSMPVGAAAVGVLTSELTSVMVELEDANEHSMTSLAAFPDTALAPSFGESTSAVIESPTEVSGLCDVLFIDLFVTVGDADVGITGGCDAVDVVLERNMLVHLLIFCVRNEWDVLATGSACFGGSSLGIFGAPSYE